MQKCTLAEMTWISFLILRKRQITQILYVLPANLRMTKILYGMDVLFVHVGGIVTTFHPISDFRLIYPP